MILSILIPTIPERAAQFTELFNALHEQLQYMETFHPTLGEIEILVDESKSFRMGGLSIGKKREALVMRAKAQYLCFVDDDDRIAPNYMETLVRLCTGVDVITFRSFALLKGYWALIDMRLGYVDEQANPNGIVKRKPWHVCPMKTEHAQKHEFEDVSLNEDHGWMSKVLTNCSTENHTDAILHQYRHMERTESDLINNV
jgi:hypothetical protein